MTQELTFWIKKILILLAFVAGLYVLWMLSSIILLVLIAGFVTIVMNPLINLWEKHKIPSWATLIGVYIVVFLLGSIVIGTLIPIIIEYVTETAALVINWVNSAQSTYISQWIQGFHFHPYIEKIIILVLGENNIEHTLDIIKQNAGNIQSVITTQISSLTSGGISVVSAVGGVVANWGLVAITTFLMVLERKRIGRFLLDIAPDNIEKYLQSHYLSIQSVTTSWMKATLILSVSIFVTTYLWLHLLEFIMNLGFMHDFLGIEEFSIDQKFTLAIIGGIMEFIPYVGPLIALIPAAIIGLGISWKVAIGVIALYLIIQRIENDVLVPYVMSKALDLSPFLVFVVMLGGATLGGILGIILAVPVAGVVRVIYGEYIRKRDDKSETPDRGSEKEAISLPIQKTPSTRRIPKK
jgi:predicted PurR-regulated permease PerM